MADEGLTYGSAGVSLEQSRAGMNAIRDSVRSTFTPEVLGDFGGFGGLFAARFGDLEEPVLVSSIDGVGTKTAVAAMSGIYSGLGKDIVGHCINDILVQGARPLFFMDYFASSSLSPEVLAMVVESAAEACRENGCALLGGETAEMPGVYCQGEFDIVGAIVGVADRSRLLPSPNIGAGDLIVGLASDGLHTNGFSLARAALFERGGMSADTPIPELGRTVAEELLRPHRCYYRALSPLLAEGLIKGLAHITGGGFYENLPRVLGGDNGAVIEKRSWSPLPIFGLIQESGGISEEEMFRVFNMGIGMVAICASEIAGAVVQRSNDVGESAYVIGEINRGNSGIAVV